MRFILVVLALVAAAPVRAAGVDMSTQTCQDWLDADDDVQDQMVAWLHGYLAGHSASTLYNAANARADTAALKAFCQNNKSVGVVSAAGLWGK